MTLVSHCWDYSITISLLEACRHADDVGICHLLSLRDFW